MKILHENEYICECDYWDDEPRFDPVEELIRCKDCKHFEYDHFDAVYLPTETGEAERVPLITAHEICTRWGDGCKTSENGYCFMAERRKDETD